MTVLRPGTAADAPTVADLWHAGWHDAHAGHVPAGLTAARTYDEFADRAPRRVADTTIAETDGKTDGGPGGAAPGEIAGFVMVVGDEVEQVYVGAPHRGSGVADELLAEAERLVAAAGHAEAWLAVVEGNARARAFYEKRGWRDAGALPYEVTSGGATYVSPCRRYVKAVTVASDA